MDRIVDRELVFFLSFPSLIQNQIKWLKKNRMDVRWWNQSYQFFPLLYENSFFPLRSIFIFFIYLSTTISHWTISTSFFSRSAFKVLMMEIKNFSKSFIHKFHAPFTKSIFISNHAPKQWKYRFLVDEPENFFFLWLLQQNHYIAYLYRYLKSCCCWNIIKQTFFFCFCSDDPGSVNRNQNEYTAFSIHIIHYITEWFFTAENNLSWLVNQFEL